MSNRTEGHEKVWGGSALKVLLHRELRCWLVSCQALRHACRSDKMRLQYQTHHAALSIPRAMLVTFSPTNEWRAHRGKAGQYEHILRSSIIRISLLLVTAVRCLFFAAFGEDHIFVVILGKDPSSRDTTLAIGGGSVSSCCPGSCTDPPHLCSYHLLPSCSGTPHRWT